MQGHPPKPPFVLVANHLSYLDVMVLGSCLNAVFVGKAEIARWPVVGPLSRLMNTIFIDRQARRDIPRALARMEKTLARGQGSYITAHLGNPADDLMARHPGQ
ncbi:MAG: lysophospholipid acyltransferase family protein [Acidobacteriota bacterium]